MIELDGKSLTLAKMERIIEHGESVRAVPHSLNKVRESRQAVEDIVSNEQVVYGITTGFGKLSDVVIPTEHTEELQHNLIRSHACGVGEPFPEKVSRAMLVLRANALLKGYSGVRVEVIEQLLTFVNRHIHPLVPQQGSLGASGDLAPLAHLTLALMGEGYVFYRGEKVPAQTALDEEGMAPLTLTAKEGLALINGTQAMTAMGAVVYMHSEKLAYQAEGMAALTFEALQGVTDALAEEVHEARGFPEQIRVAERMRQFLQGSQLTTRQGEIRVQDAYSLRCIPQVHGATWQTLQFVKNQLEIEMNAATDNPLIFDGGQKVISGGNFHGQPIALAMDYVGIAMAELANISERRIERLVNPQLNDLPPFLSPQPGRQSGAMILQYTAASLVSENKSVAHPASVDSIPSSANQEDHVSMGTIASRQAAMILQNTRKVIAIEAICAMQALEFRDKDMMAPRTHSLYTEGRNMVQPLNEDRVFAEDIDRIDQWLQSSEWSDLLVGEEDEVSGYTL